MADYPIGHQLTILETVDSSNNYAMGQVKAGRANHGTVYFALEQTAGKGQWGRSWIAEPGVNIMMSIVLETTAVARFPPFSLSMAVALACHDWMTQQAKAECYLKWPNDLYWRDRKAGGILIENKWAGAEWQFAVVGIGINLNQTQFSPLARKPVSMKQITGREYDLMASVREVLECLEVRWQQLCSAQLETLRREYEGVLWGMGKVCTFRKEGISFSATVTGVAESGELLTDRSPQNGFRVGELEWL